MACDRWFDLETPHEIVRVKPGGLYLVRVPGAHVSATLEKLHDVQQRACRDWDAEPFFLVVPEDVTLDKLERPLLEKLAREAGLLPPAGDPAF